MTIPEPPPTRSLSGKAMRFAIVGVANAAIDLVVFALLLRSGVWPLTANVLAWGVAVSFSYLVNSRWSFDRDANLSTVHSVARFVSLGALISLGVSSGFIVALSSVIGVWPAKIVGLLVAAVLNFMAARWSIENRLK